MDNLDDLMFRIDKVVSEVKDIIKIFEIEITDPHKAISFAQVKEIETTIERLKRQNLPIPNELNKLKLSLFSNFENHKEMISLCNKFQENIHSILSSEILRATDKTQIREPKIGKSSHRKPYNYIKPLGSKGNTNLEDYLIPVIKLMRKGQTHTEAFNQIAKDLDVRYSTVSAQCTRALKLTTVEFLDQVKSNKIVHLLETKYQEYKYLIDSQLK
jgi:hypothetical protein